MRKIKIIKSFFKDFYEQCKVFYSLYSFLTSTLNFSLFIIFFSEQIVYLILIELIILITPILYFLIFSYENKVICEIFYYFEKLGRYKTKPQLVNSSENEIIIINSKTYRFYLQLKIGKKIKNYEIFWENRENIEISLVDIIPSLKYEDNKLICSHNENYSYNLVIEFTYLNSEPVNIEFIIFSKIKKKINEIKKLNIKLR